MGPSSALLIRVIRSWTVLGRLRARLGLRYWLTTIGGNQHTWSWNVGAFDELLENRKQAKKDSGLLLQGKILLT